MRNGLNISRFKLFRSISEQRTPPKGPNRTINTTAKQNMVNYYAVAFLLHPPYLLCREPFFERQNACKTKENGIRTRVATIVNHYE